MKAFLDKHHAIAAVSVVLLFIVVLVFGLLFTWSLLEAKQSEVEARQRGSVEIGHSHGFGSSGASGRRAFV